MRTRVLMLLAVVASLLAFPAVAGALTWDADTLTDGVQENDGFWVDGEYYWWNGTANEAWSNLNPTVAQFGNTASTAGYAVEVGAGGVTATELAFFRGYTIKAPGTVTLSGTAPLVRMIDTTPSATAVTITANMVVTDGNPATEDDLIVRGANGGTPGSAYWKIVLGTPSVNPTNSYSGKMRVENGALVDLFSPTGLSSTSTGTVVGAGCALRILGASGTYGSGQTLELSGYGFGVSNNLHNSRAAFMFSPTSMTDNVTWAGNIVLNADSSSASTQTVGTYRNIISGVISGGFKMVKTSDTALTLTNSNTYTGNTEIRRGGLNLNSSLGQAINKDGGNLVFRADLGSTAAVIQIERDEQIGDGAEVQFLYTGSTAGFQTVNLLGHTETVKGLVKSTTSATSAYVQNEGADLSAGKLVLDTAGSSFSFNGVIRDSSAASMGTLSLEKKGLGTQTLAGANTYTGPTVIKAGALAVDGSITSDVTVEGGALMGIGTVTGNVVAQTGGSVAPGDSAGTLTVTGNADLSSSGGMTWELGALKDDAGGGVAGTDFDFASIAGNLTLGGTSQLTLDFNLLAEADRPGYGTPNTFWANDHSWKIVDLGELGTTTGDFTTLVNYAFTGVGTFDTRVAGNDVFLDFDSTYNPLPPIPGDTNNNRTIDDTDAAVVAGNWGTNVGTGGYASGDFNGDGWVNAADAAIQVANWGSHVSEAATGVPEPATFTLLLAGCLSLLAARRRR